MPQHAPGEPPIPAATPNLTPTQVQHNPQNNGITVQGQVGNVVLQTGGTRSRSPPARQQQT
eukprot:9291375-Prorocentrum_lima.AAC.1